MPNSDGKPVLTPSRQEGSWWAATQGTLAVLLVSVMDSLWHSCHRRGSAGVVEALFYRRFLLVRESVKIVLFSAIWSHKK
jgi:hypothetical protein